MKRTTIYLLVFLLQIILPLSVFSQKSIVEGLEVTWKEVNKLPTSITANINYRLIADITTNGIVITNNRTVRIDLNGHKLSSNENSGQSLILGDWDHKNNKLYIYDSSAENENGIGGGGSIEGGTGDRGGTLFAYGGEIELYGGTIRNSRTEFTGFENNHENYRTKGGGGAFYLQGGCKFTMYGGIISECTTKYTIEKNTSGTYYNIGAGGAVFIDADNSNTTTFTMKGGVIESCEAGIGGAVFVNNYNNYNAEFIMEGGEIRGCKALYPLNVKTTDVCQNGGGAVMVYQNQNQTKQSAFKMYGGTIKDCQSAGYGMAVNSLGTVTISGGSIINCSPHESNVNAQYGGGGVALSGSKSTLTMSGGTIAKNKAGIGGGIYMVNYSSLEMTGGIIYSNIANTAADDIYSDGNYTTVVLPEATSMNFDNYEGPIQGLKWVKDESSYRYRDAVKNINSLNPLGFYDSGTHTQELNLAIGYERAILTLEKKGLKNGDHAMFRISYPKDNEYVEYRNVIVKGTGNDIDTKVLLPTGIWKVEETSWSSPKYTPTYSTTNGIIEIKKDGVNTLTVTNASKEVDIRNVEESKENTISK